MRRALVVAAASVLVLCACTTYRVQQSSLVPAATLPAPPAAGGLADFYLEDSTVTFLSQPELAPSSEAGLFVPRHQLQGALSLRMGEYFGFRGLVREGLDEGALAAAPTTLPNPGRNVRAWGQGWFAIVPLAGPRHRLHIAVDYHVVSVPSYVRAVCVSNCEGESPGSEGRQRNSTLQTALAMGYVYKPIGPLDLRLTAALMSHPTNQREFTSDAPSAEVESGPTYVVLGFGAEIHATSYLSLLPYVSWPLSGEPIEYGPILGLGVRGTLPYHRRPQPDDVEPRGEAQAIGGARRVGRVL